MKRKLFIVISLVLVLSACAGAIDKETLAVAPSAAPAAAAAPELMNEMAYDGMQLEEAYSSTSSYAGESGGGVGASAGEAVQSSLSDKIIYTASADIETTDFDASVQEAYALLSKYDAFIESSSISGVNLSAQKQGRFVGRYAYFSLRVSSKDYTAMTHSLSTLGNVLYQSSNAENVSYQYYDTESRLNTYRTEEERLFSMLEKAVNVEEMIAIEERLSNVRYEIESLTTTLIKLQNEIDYSTVNVSINEVLEYTEEIIQPVQLTYWQRLSGSVSESVAMVGLFFQQLLIVFVSAIPILFFPAVIAIAVWRILVRRKKKKAVNNDSKNDTENL